MSNVYFDPMKAPWVAPNLQPTVRAGSPKPTPVGVSSIRYTVALPADWLTVPWPPLPKPPAAPAPAAATAPKARKPKPKSKPPVPEDELAARRAARQALKEQQRAAQDAWRRREQAAYAFADDLLIDLSHRSLAIPLHVISVVRSLVDASVLQAVAQASGRALAETGSPWASRPSDRHWQEAAGVSLDEWMGARRRLRALGLIDERTRIDPETRSIVLEFSFDPDAWRMELETLRTEIVESQLANGDSLPPQPLAG